MASSSTRSIGIGTGILVGLALAVGAATGSAGTADQSAWQQALHVRSEGLNATYGVNARSWHAGSGLAAGARRSAARASI